MATKQKFVQLLSTNGYSTGVTQMAAAADVYLVAPPPGWVFSLHRCLIYIEDNGKFRADYYGATGALTNGIVVSFEGKGKSLRLMTPKPIQKIWEWGLVAGTDVILTDVTTGSDVVLVRWSFDKAGDPIRLRGSQNEYLKFDVRDNLGGGGAALVSHLVSVQGEMWEEDVHTAPYPLF